MGTLARVFLTALIGGVAACGRPPHLSGGPIDLSERPTIVRFDQPVPSYGHTWELCFEFERPRDSHRAATIHAILVSRSGSREPIHNPTLDRRGESTVCQIGQVTPSRTGSEEATYESVELYSDVPLRLRGLRGGRRPPHDEAPQRHRPHRNQRGRLHCAS